MDILQLIKEEHESIRKKIKVLLGEQYNTDTKHVFGDLSHDLRLHLKLESEYLYPEVSELFPEGKVLIRLSLSNHDEIIAQIDKLDEIYKNMNISPKNLHDMIEVLGEKVEAHYKLEEENFMPKIRQLINTQDREDLGQVFVDVKDEIKKSAVKRTRSKQQREKIDLLAQ